MLPAIVIHIIRRIITLHTMTNAFTAQNPDVFELIIRMDNGSQFVYRAFRAALIPLGARQKYLHKILKKEHVWPCEFRSYQDRGGNYRRSSGL